MKQRPIFFDGLGLVEGHFSGIGQYILGILRGLDQKIENDKLAGKSTRKIYVIIPYNSRGRFYEFGFKHIEPKIMPLSFRIMSGLWHRGKMPPLDLFFGSGDYIFTRFVTMPLLFSKSAVVIYDLSYELHKEYSDEKNAKFLSKGVRRSLKQVDKVITISENAKREIRDFYNYPEDKIIVATPAVDQRYFYRRGSEEIERVKRKYNIQGDYILALSNLEPRKNLDSLVDVYCDLPIKIRSDLSLLLVGVNGWKIESLFNKILKRVEKGYKIIRPSSYVSDKDKPAIISGAKMLVYPSHYEGFGIPPLEALACGTPVICADNSSLPEVIGDTAVMVPSTSKARISEEVRSCLDNYEIISKRIRIKGPQQARKFSLEKSAAKYLEIFDK